MIEKNDRGRDQVALVTGASRGIGQAIANVLAKTGIYVVGTATSEQGALSIQKQFIEQDLQGHALVLDVTDADSIKEFEKQLKLHAMPTILVNNAGIIKDNFLMRMKDEEWDNVINTNLNAIYKITKICLRNMLKARYGRIINITSVIAMLGNAGQTNYAASKAGIIGFTRSLAKEVGSRGITVNAVAPGFIETDMTQTVADAQRQQMLTQIALNRFGTPIEIAGIVKFLASDEASYITGETINVNGGI